MPGEVWAGEDMCAVRQETDGGEPDGTNEDIRCCRWRQPNVSA